MGKQFDCGFGVIVAQRRNSLIAGLDPRVAGGLDAELSKLEELLARLAHAPQWEECVSAQEHIEAAHASLLGGMSREYALDLALADQAISGIPDKHVRDKGQRELAELREARVTPHL
jgi:hypothetical protein